MNYYLGIDLGGTAIKIGITDDAGNIKVKDSFDTRVSEEPEKLISHFADCALEVISKSGIEPKKIIGAGIGAPGLLNPQKGELLFVTNLQMLNGFNLVTPIQKKLGIPTFLDNDVNAMALGEFYYGAAKGYTNIVAITLGTGIGGGLILNGKLYQGSSFTAGEIGHMSIDSNGLLCNCGNYGCIERYACRDGIIDRFKAYYYHKEMESSIENYLDDGAITPKAISQAAEEGDHLAKLVLSEVGTYLGNALASYVNILNPELIVIGGGIANAGDLLLEPARQEMKKRAYTVPAQTVKVVRAQLLNDAGILGSASIAVSNLSQ